LCEDRGGSAQHECDRTDCLQRILSHVSPFRVDKPKLKEERTCSAGVPLTLCDSCQQTIRAHDLEAKTWVAATSASPCVWGLGRCRSLTDNIDATTASGRMFFHMMGALAQFERDLIRERTNAGFKAARERGNVGGRPRKLTDADLKFARSLMRDKSEHWSWPAVATRLGVSHMTLWRAMKRDPSEIHTQRRNAPARPRRQRQRQRRSRQVRKKRRAQYAALSQC
jgi:Resolvase, N terminal domain